MRVLVCVCARANQPASAEVKCNEVRFCSLKVRTFFFFHLPENQENREPLLERRCNFLISSTSNRLQIRSRSPCLIRFRPPLPCLINTLLGTKFMEPVTISPHQTFSHCESRLFTKSVSRTSQASFTSLIGQVLQ